ncbi:Alcohol dehydrogenase GroES-like domain-containing protein [Cladophialophora immunda]|nr:Alcohol dehydrogenase GroES-like domain-containing protein [Cladophialophora immunda]
MTLTLTEEYHNTAVVLSAIDDLSIKLWPLNVPTSQGQPLLPDGHVLVRVKATGICGSDIHYWKHGQGGGPHKVTKPFVVGHECAGEIALVASDVLDWKKGDRVAIKPAAPCLQCSDCTRGNSNLCPKMIHFGSPPFDGSAMKFKVVPRIQLARLAPDVTWVEAGVIQPLAIAVQATRQTGNFAQKAVIIFGGGFIGSLLAFIAKAYGAIKVVIVEKEEHRAQFLRDHVTKHVFVDPPRDQSEEVDVYAERLARLILEKHPDLDRGFDIVIDASGSEECMNMGIRVARPGATYVQLGIRSARDSPRIPMMIVLSRQLTLRVSKTEPYSYSYYWGQDLDGEPDTLWGLEGYYHPIGFFLGHVSTDIFKEEMRKVDDDKLLRNVQGLNSPDYDLHHYDFFSGFIKRDDDKDRDAMDSFVVVVHLWAAEGKRKQLLGILADVADRVKASEKTTSITVQSFGVLKEVNDLHLATAYIRTRTESDWLAFQASENYRRLMEDAGSITVRQEAHRSKAFIGHIGQEAPVGDP